MGFIFGNHAPSKLFDFWEFSKFLFSKLDILFKNLIQFSKFDSVAKTLHLYFTASWLLVTDMNFHDNMIPVLFINFIFLSVPIVNIFLKKILKLH